MRIKIKETRQRLGVSQTQLAERCDISRPFLAQLEGGKRNLTASRQNQIAQALGIKPEELIDFSGPSEDEQARLIRAFLAASPAERNILMKIVQTILEDPHESDP